MITEDFVSFETAKLLKEKGFESDECVAIYDLGDNNAFIRDSGIFENGPEDYLEFQRGEEWRRFGYYLAPTLQMARKWLIENYNIHIEVRYFPMPNIYRYVIIHSPATFENIDSHPQYFNTYEEACEAAIKYCLENLI